MESLNNDTSILCFNYLNMHQVLWYCVHVPVQLLGWNVRKDINQAQFGFVKKRSPWYVRSESSKIHMESHIARHGRKDGGINTLLACTS